MRPNQVTQILINHFDPDNYTLPAHLTTPEQQLGYIVKTEYLHPSTIQYHKGNRQRACREWLMGLPSCLNLPFTYHDIGHFIDANGFGNKDKDSFDSDAQLILYWSRFAFAVLKCVESYEAINHEK